MSNIINLLLRIIHVNYALLICPLDHPKHKSTHLAKEPWLSMTYILKGLKLQAKTHPQLHVWYYIQYERCQQRWSTKSTTKNAPGNGWRAVDPTHLDWHQYPSCSLKHGPWAKGIECFENKLLGWLFNWSFLQTLQQHNWHACIQPAEMNGEHSWGDNGENGTYNLGLINSAVWIYIGQIALTFVDSPRWLHKVAQVCHHISTPHCPACSVKVSTPLLPSLWSRFQGWPWWARHDSSRCSFIRHICLEWDPLWNHLSKSNARWQCQDRKSVV